MERVETTCPAKRPTFERFNKSLVALSREGVVSSHSVIATGLCSRHGVEFGTLRVCQFCRQEAVESAIVGAPKCLQNSAHATLKHSEGPRGAVSCFGATRAARAALFAGRSLGSCWTVARELFWSDARCARGSIRGEEPWELLDGARELERRALRARLCSRGEALGAAGRWLVSCFGATRAARAALFAGRSLGSCWTVARELLALQLLRGSWAAVLQLVRLLCCNS